MMPGPRSPRASNGHAPGGGEPDGDPEKESELSEAWRRVRGRVPEIAQQALRYASVQMDRGRLSLRRAVLRAALAAWVAVAALAGTVIGVLMLARGLSGGLGVISQNQHVLRTQILPSAGDLALPLAELTGSGLLDPGSLILNSFSVDKHHHALDMSCSGGTIRLASGY